MQLQQQYQHPHGPYAVEIYCAGCHRPSVLRDSFACTECISGFCSDCVYALSSQPYHNNNNDGGSHGGGGGRRGGPIADGLIGGIRVPRSTQEPGRGGRCPRCGEGGRYKAFQLDIR